jgi:hypothetical protein
MTNVHDVFYPSETRLHSLVIGGEYFVSAQQFCLLGVAHAEDHVPPPQKYLDGVRPSQSPCVLRKLIVRPARSQFNSSLENFKMTWLKKTLVSDSAEQRRCALNNFGISTDGSTSLTATSSGSCFTIVGCTRRPLPSCVLSIKNLL